MSQGTTESRASSGVQRGRLLTIDEVAELLQMHPRTIRKMLAEELADPIPHLHVRSNLRFPEAMLVNWIERRARREMRARARAYEPAGSAE